MKTIRKKVFETNSSSTHSLTIVSKADYEKFEAGEVFRDWDDNMLTIEEIVEKEKDNKEFMEAYEKNKDNYSELEDLLREHEYYSYSNFHYDSYETFSQPYKTESGDEVVAFGYFGADY